VTEAHPTVWKLIRGLKREATAARLDIVAEEAGRDALRRRPNVLAAHSRLRDAVLSWDPTTPIPYLRRIAHNFKY
jgi:hypothetical protein